MKIQELNLEHLVFFVKYSRFS